MQNLRFQKIEGMGKAWPQWIAAIMESTKFPWSAKTRKPKTFISTVDSQTTYSFYFNNHLID